MIDKALLLEALARVEAEASKPESESLWDQAEWCKETMCGTAYCFAGWILKVFSEHDPTRIDLSGVADAHTVLLDARRRVHIKDAARFVAGLDTFQADMLFSPARTLEGLRQCVEFYLSEQEEREQEKK